MRPWLQKGLLYGQYEQLMVELEADDPAGFKNIVRMKTDMFQELLNRLGPTIFKKDTWYRTFLHPGLRMAITLCFLATGDSYHSLIYCFRVAHNTICIIVQDV